MRHFSTPLGQCVLLALGALAPAVAPAEPPAAPPALGPEIVDPQVVTPVDGVLQFTLTARPAPVTIAGRRVIANVYNGAYIPPVLRLRRGDELRLRFINEIGPSEIEINRPEVSNVHYHGMAIPPVQPADDVYMLVPPAGGVTAEHHLRQEAHDPHGSGDSDADEGHTAHLAGADLKPTNTYDYRWTVPADHALGLFWYHPHPHGISEAQVLSGMAGMLVIDDFIARRYPELSDLKSRTLILKDAELPGAEETDAKTKTINGTLGGTLTARPGAFEVWEIGNLGADAYFDLAVDGHEVWVLERDGNALDAPELTDHVYLPPASRARIVIDTGAPGRYAVRTRAIDTGGAGDPNPEVVLATFNVAGPASVADAGAIRARLGEPPAALAPGPPIDAEIAAMPVTRKRTIRYTQNADGTVFFINGKVFDMNRIDVEVSLGDVEEWTILNDTDERHTFHIHQMPFLVQSVNGNPLETTGKRDNVDVPFRDPKTQAPGMVQVKIAFTNPLIVGKFPFHCHILEHEDGGMMANIIVRPRQ